MAEIKLTKNELRAQQKRLAQLRKYLPTLQLKKALLQVEIHEARQVIETCLHEVERVRDRIDSYAALLTEQTSVDIQQVAKIARIDKTYENIAGVEIPVLKEIHFEPATYGLFETPAWVDGVVFGLREATESQVRLAIAKQRKEALEYEWRQVSIRVNLFEKILIPRSMSNIKKIKVFLGDQELSAVARAKVAKEKAESKRLSGPIEGASHAH